MGRKTKTIILVLIAVLVALIYFGSLQVKKVNSCSSIIEPPVLSAISKDDVLKREKERTSCQQVVEKYSPQTIQDCIKRSITGESEVGANGLSFPVAIELCSNGYTDRISEEDRNNLGIERLVAKRLFDAKSLYTISEALGVDDSSNKCTERYPKLIEREEGKADSKIWYETYKRRYESCLQENGVGFWFRMSELMRGNSWE